MRSKTWYMRTCDDCGSLVAEHPRGGLFEHDCVGPQHVPHRPPTTAPSVTCPATVTVHDDHWGAWVTRCDLDAGHEGDHRSARTACEPVAYLGWAGTTDDERTT